ADLIMATDALVRGSTIGDDSGSRWEVDGASTLSRIIVDLYPKGSVGLAGSGRGDKGTGDDTGSGGKGI
ncbi:hypothetical protein Tco_0544516, partial [Tanacetum coccineum]